MSTPRKALSTCAGEIPLDVVAGEIRSGNQDYVIVRIGESTPEAVLVAWRGERCQRLELGGAHFALIAARTPADELAGLLTGREVQIAVLVSQGMPNKMVGDHLRISEWTVATHLRRIFAKLQVTSRAEMVYRCASLIGRAGGVEPSEVNQRMA